MQIIFFLVSLLASIAGAICGIGGGVVIKPTLDMLHLASVPTISFLSGCTVLSMSCYSVAKGMLAHDSQIDLKTGTPLAIGAAIGGVVGQNIFIAVKTAFENANMVGSIQAVCLFLMTFGTFLYTLKKDRIRTHHVAHPIICVIIGLGLGMLSSFLGIGGGPMNLVVLGFFFSMQTKMAAQNSLYIILFSQCTSLISTWVKGTIPAFDPLTLVFMVAGGIGGGVIGRILNKRIDSKVVDKLFLLLMVLIMLISLLNAYRFTID